ncbi:MAG: hypothetical protein IJ794_13880 [Lachnospiraceae bacterium]|nr:hypothetical protein [Lachnospiraceae bacterium]
MINWEDVLKAEDNEELREAKMWLFQENMRLQQEKTRIEQDLDRLEKERKTIEEARDKFNSERMCFKDEMNALNRKSVVERQRMKDEKLFFDKKLAILQNGFLQLDIDRKNFEREKIEFYREKESYSRQSRSNDYYDYGDLSGVVGVLFRNATNPLSLRKRYKDLMKIFHPDNLAGDEELVQMINTEFSRRKREEA